MPEIARCVAPVGTLMPRSELVALYGGKGIAADRLTITYRCIGVRSARAWIVLAELLGHPCERIDDGP